MVLIGLCIGSFCNVIIHRTPRFESVVLPRSHCPSCKKQLFWWHNIPLISFIILRKKCYFCQKKIAFIYPMVEVLGALIGVSLFYKIGFGFEFLLLWLIFAFLMSLSMIDLRYKAVPHGLLIATLSLTILQGLTSFHLIDFVEHLNDMLLILGIFYLIREYVSFFLKQEAMGEGDIIIGAIMGGILGFKLSCLAIFFGALLALPFSIIYKIKGDKELPFIPFW